jgi:heme/copper-type cytochrome/quinol oxidase subunit 2
MQTLYGSINMQLDRVLLAPGNDVMSAILSLLVETLVYGVVIIWMVVFLLHSCVSMFSVDNAGARESFDVRAEQSQRIKMYTPFMEGSRVIGEHEFWEVTWNALCYYAHMEHFMYRRTRRVGFPIYFSRRAESLLDFLFLILPTCVVILILVPTLGFLYSNEFMYGYATTSFAIDVIGHQWYWSYEYSFSDLEDHLDVSFDSILDVDAVENVYLEVDKRLVIPTDVRVSLTVTSTDVIHSWAVPQLGIKIDAVPGRLSNSVLSSFIDGVFYGQCSELCGVLHGFMPISVESVPMAVFYNYVYINSMDTL